MALTDPRAFYGIHSVSPYNRTTGEFYGELRVLENSSMAISAELIDLVGGSNRFTWATEVGAMTAEMSLSFSEFPDFVFELFAGNAPTTNAAETTGSITTLTDVKGTVVDATTGIASVDIIASSETDLKFGKYIIKVLSETTVDVFFSSDADMGRGTDGEYQNDLLKITASPLTITDTGATVTIPNFGVEITSGSGTIALVTLGALGDTAEFYVRPPNTKSMDVVIGARTSQSFPEFGAIVMAEKLGTGEMIEAEAYKCKGAGLPLGFTRNTWSVAEVTVKMSYDSAKDGVIALRHITPTTA
ncbi:hypothetical protein KAR91_40780 [Candidatus Pacearchaeota archaeon]|nr:hypothetical protein [Candidatus Pacearchaeota archaeon]